MQYDSLIFDMDGTLWDNVNAYVRAWNMAFEQMGYSRRVVRDDLLGLMGKEIGYIIESVLPGTSEKKSEELMHAIFGAYNAIASSIEPTVFPGVIEGLEKLSARYKLFLLSNCEEGGLVKFMQHTRTRHLFTDYMEYGQNYRPKNENLRLLIERNRLKNSVYVGDTASDSRESRKAGVPFVFVSYGFGHTDDYALRFDTFGALTDYFWHPSG